VIEIVLNNGMITVVDDADYHLVNDRHWYAFVDKRGYIYARGKIKRDGKWVAELMHRVIMSATPAVVVDHEDGKTLRNLRHNLRCCSRGQNACNRHKVFGESIYKGVWWNRQLEKWQAAVVKDRKRHHVGVFFDELEAAWAYDELAMVLHGEFARLNFEAARMLTRAPWKEKVA
jgi:hypothetical protein